MDNLKQELEKIEVKEGADSNLLEKLDRIVEEIPLGNSRYQIQEMICKKESASRSLKAAVINAKSRRDALQTAAFGRLRLQVKIDQLHDKIEKETDVFERKLMEIDLQEMKLDLKNQEKMIKDAVYEFNAYAEVIEVLPNEMTREQFEMLEHDHWEQKALNDIRVDLVAHGRAQEGSERLLNNVKNPARKEDGSLSYNFKRLEVKNHKLNALEGGK